MLPGGVTGSILTSTIASNEPVNLVYDLVFSLLGNWALVKDRATALIVMTAQSKEGGVHRWSIVTLSGEVFKSDGEIVAMMPVPKRDGPGGVDKVPAYQYGLSTTLQALPGEDINDQVAFRKSPEKCTQLHPCMSINSTLSDYNQEGREV